jgi:DNA-binding CsgD family transcriptional regulator
MRCTATKRDGTTCGMLASKEEAISQRNLASEAFAILSSREKQLLHRFAQGKTDRKIAVEIVGTERQVSAQRERLLRKLHIQTAVQLVSAATRFASWPAQPRASASVSGGDTLLHRRLSSSSTHQYGY